MTNHNTTIYLNLQLTFEQTKGLAKILMGDRASFNSDGKDIRDQILAMILKGVRHD